MTEENQKVLDEFIYGLNLKDLIIDSASAYKYCYEIKDEDEVMRLIKDSDYAYRYCRFIRYDPKIRKHIKD